jgi:alpha-L-rhamnosidase
MASVAWSRADGRLRLDVVVPVGAGATVHVPDGSGPVEVRHGAHSWEVADPVAAPRPLPVDATLRDLLDHEEAWRAVAAIAVEDTDAADEAAAARRLMPHLDRNLTEVALALDPDGGFRPRGRQLAQRLEEVLSRYR